MDTGAGRGKANQKKQSKVKARKKADYKERFDVKAPQKAGMKKQRLKPLRRQTKKQSDVKAPQKADKKQSVLDGFFQKSQGHMPKTPTPTTGGQSAETPFIKSGKGPE
ncbi:hypothetical protein N7519_003297 [Penicillium mononematosum]|uniref:uncharacterized protein n=1 Tax=Penicillium mononematosum TaxID=268346 RepID=UPI0025489C9D|nr:uncharacterized protein N7519_003297 [Penicillium mononematosum]KAJ6188389.1 hypothetical protein N7519_003297 [Penicillium mononematosum]